MGVDVNVVSLRSAEATIGRSPRPNERAGVPHPVMARLDRAIGLYSSLLPDHYGDADGPVAPDHDGEEGFRVPASDDVS
jgi:hypothetical protein